MAHVECEVKETQVENERRIMVDGVCATCSACGHATEAFGTGAKSINRTLAMMREECPENEENFYVQE